MTLAAFALGKLLVLAALAATAWAAGRPLAGLLRREGEPPPPPGLALSLGLALAAQAGLLLGLVG